MAPNHGAKLGSLIFKFVKNMMDKNGAGLQRVKLPPSEKGAINDTKYLQGVSISKRG